MASPVPKPPDARQRRAAVAGNPVRRLPASGRTGPVPKPPVPLGTEGRRWWRWAWKTPQALTWHVGTVETLVKRAQMEDRFAATDAPPDMARITALILRLDDALGLSPTGAAKLHFTFVDDEPETVVPAGAKNVTPIRNRLKGMRE